MAKDNPKTPHTAKDFEQIGRMLVSITESGYANKSQFYKMSFLKGVVAGFGGVLGATIVVTLLLWILSFFDTIPFVQNIVDTINTPKK